MPSGTQFSRYPVTQGNPYMAPSIQGVVPGLTGLTTSATNLIGSQLGGMPSPAETRTANAAWGAGAGLSPGTPFLENRGRRLYQSEIENRQNTGLQNLLRFLQGYSGTVAGTPGQLMAEGARSTQQEFENELSTIDRDLTQRRLDEANRPREFSQSSQRTGGPRTYAYRFFR